MKYLILSCIAALALSCNTSKPSPTKTASTNPSAIESRESARTYTCMGNEPFWSVQIKGKEIIFRTPDDLTPGPYKVEMRAIFGKDKMRIGVLGTILQVE